MHRTLNLICRHAEIDNDSRQEHDIYDIHDIGFMNKIRSVSDIQFERNYGVLNRVLHVLKRHSVKED